MSEHPIIRHLKEQAERSEAERERQRERDERSLQVVSLQSEIGWYGETEGTQEPTTLEGFAGLLRGFLAAVRAAGDEKGLQVLDCPGDASWACAVEVYRL